MKPVIPRYRLLEAAYLQPACSAGPSKFDAGAEIAFEGPPTFGMVPLNAPAVAAKAASIRAHGISRLRQPSAGDRSVLTTLTRSIGGSVGTVDEMVDQIQRWLSKNPTSQPQQEPNP